MATKKKNPQDITLRNLHALKKQIDKLQKDMKQVKQEVKKKANK
ncbi:MAG TPA: hypothetical protein VLB46_11835 [Pyrinomonadaceae bacterium]|nr:hypothetical protein [Pyrinomonadaceae bacterium]